MDSGRKTRSRSDEPRALWRRRTSREPSRVVATCEETDGANSQDEPKVRREADAEQRLRRPPGRVRNTLERSRKGSGGERGTIAKANKDALPPEPECPEDHGNVRRGASARL
jgi:hypothetical protein